MSIYLHCIDGQRLPVSQRIEDALDAGASVPRVVTVRESERLYAPSAPPQTLSAICTRTRSPGPAHSPRPQGPPGPQHRMQTLAITSVSAGQIASQAISAEAGRCPDPAHA